MTPTIPVIHADLGPAARAAFGRWVASVYELISHLDTCCFGCTAEQARCSEGDAVMNAEHEQWAAWRTAPFQGGNIDPAGGDAVLVDDQVLEAIAEQIHAAWAAEKLRQGVADHPWPADWHEGIKHADTCAVPVAQHHPDMLPYRELAEHVKAYDRVTAQAALSGIEAAGYRLVKEDAR